MLAAILTVALAFDPIPKLRPGEGRIALYVREPKATLIVLSPDGDSEKRFDLAGLGEMGDDIISVRLFRDGRSALIVTGQWGSANERSQCWLLDLAGTKKPRKILERSSWITVVPDDNGLVLYMSYPDRDKIKKVKRNDDRIPIQCGTYDIASGKTALITIPDEYQIVDVSTSTQTILVEGNIDNKQRTGIYSLKTGKMTLLDRTNLSPLCFSANGQSILTRHLVEHTNGDLSYSGIAVLDIRRDQYLRVETPIGSRGYVSYSLSPDGRRVCYVVNSLVPAINSVVRTLYVADRDGSNAKRIYESKPGEQLADCDWR